MLLLLAPCITLCRRKSQELCHTGLPSKKSPFNGIIRARSYYCISRCHPGPHFAIGPTVCHMCCAIFWFLSGLMFIPSVKEAQLAKMAFAACFASFSEWYTMCWMKAFGVWVMFSTTSYIRPEIWWMMPAPVRMWLSQTQPQSLHPSLHPRTCTTTQGPFSLEPLISLWMPAMVFCRPGLHLGANMLSATTLCSVTLFCSFSLPAVFVLFADKRVRRP
jgi:hypothetical protein